MNARQSAVRVVPEEEVVASAPTKDAAVIDRLQLGMNFSDRSAIVDAPDVHSPVRAYENQEAVLRWGGAQERLQVVQSKTRCDHAKVWVENEAGEGCHSVLDEQKPRAVPDQTGMLSGRRNRRLGGAIAAANLDGGGAWLPAPPHGIEPAVRGDEIVRDDFRARRGWDERARFGSWIAGPRERHRRQPAVAPERVSAVVVRGASPTVRLHRCVRVDRRQRRRAAG